MAQITCVGHFAQCQVHERAPGRQGGGAALPQVFDRQADRSLSPRHPRHPKEEGVREG